MFILFNTFFGDWLCQCSVRKFIILSQRQVYRRQGGVVSLFFFPAKQNFPIYNSIATVHLSIIQILAKQMWEFFLVALTVGWSLTRFPNKDKLSKARTMNTILFHE